MSDFGPCQPWELLCAEFPDGSTPELEATAAQIATEILWKRTKQQFGLCEITLRPCRKECFGSWPFLPYMQGFTDVTGWSYPFPALVGGAWMNIACGSCTSGCSCSTVSETKLPYPVHDIVEVEIDGVVLPSDAYRVDDWSLLVRTDGGEWPLCNDLSKDLGEKNTWGVTANYGKDVPELGKLAAGQLAVEIVKYCLRDNTCALPLGTVQQVSRQGVTKTFFDSEAAFAKGNVGLYYPDLFVKTYNPTNTGLATIFDIDGQRTRRTNT